MPCGVASSSAWKRLTVGSVSLRVTPSAVPIVIRLTGTNEEIAVKILADNGYTASSDMDEAVKRAVELAKGGKAA